MHNKEQFTAVFKIIRLLLKPKKTNYISTPYHFLLMRLSSSLSLLVFILAFISVLTPAMYDTEGFAVNWIDLHESPPLWILLAATLLVGLHDVELLSGIKFLTSSNSRIIRLVLIAIAIGMSYAMELSVNYHLSSSTFWTESIIFQVPARFNYIQIQDLIGIGYHGFEIQDLIGIGNHGFAIQDLIGIGYHLIRLCRVILLFGFLEALIEKNPLKGRVHIEKLYEDSFTKDKKKENSF